MAYNFEFNLRKLPKDFFLDLTKAAKKHKIHRKLGKTSRNIVKKFRVNERLGVPLDDAVTIVEDLVDTYIDNILSVEDVKKARQKILLVPHCCRKYMDSRCKAKFDAEYASYFCNNCSKDCFANRATKAANDKGYQVYILPGGSCIKKLMKKVQCEAIIGIACGEELKLGKAALKDKRIPTLGLPLTKNGCANTEFNVANLKKMMAD
ncbi:MAG: DUF116 domain-containing protein [Candidatus Aenigmarchaeota archaeon]|nr:DUF116 domain-containing protein [Candidatus Aenigmarchaeota archaeon]